MGSAPFVLPGVSSLRTLTIRTLTIRTLTIRTLTIRTLTIRTPRMARIGRHEGHKRAFRGVRSRQGVTDRGWPAILG